MKASTSQSAWQGIDAWFANVIHLLSLGGKKTYMYEKQKSNRTAVVKQVQWDNQMTAGFGGKKQLLKAVWMHQILHDIRELWLIFLDVLLHAEASFVMIPTITLKGLKGMHICI